jgi:hypothetical protein
MGKHVTLGVVLAMAVAAVTTPATAQIAEMEPNDTIETADPISGEADISGSIRVTSELDAADFFLVSDLLPGEDYEVAMGNTFLGIGHWAANGTLLDFDAFNGAGAQLTVTADGNGEMILSVCGHVAPASTDLDCTGDAAGGGQYLLTVELPEPGAGLLGATALVAIAGGAARRRRRP